ncbi:methyltransferase domain-containing protein, partial [Nocardioides massiliensis]
ATLEGRTFPVPADTDRFLAATYGPSWRVPDPAYVFETPESTHRRLNGWFRGIRVKRQEWERTWSGERLAEPALEPTDFARWVYAEEPALDHILDVGCGRGVDAYWFATQGVQTHGLDFVPRAAARLAARAASEGVPAEFGSFNLLELRSVLGYGARAARLEGRRAVTARHVADATDAWGRRNLWRYASMALHEGGNLYLEFLVQPGGDGRGREHLRTLPVGLVVEELEACGARIRHHEVLEVPPVDASGQPRRTGRLVATWER